MVDVVVVGISAVALAFILVWWRRPELRGWMEAPKHRMLLQENRYGRTARARAEPAPDPETASERERAS